LILPISAFQSGFTLSISLTCHIWNVLDALWITATDHVRRTTQYKSISKSTKVLSVSFNKIISICWSKFCNSKSWLWLILNLLLYKVLPLYLFVKLTFVIIASCAS
jgi:hypothetical protein